MDDLFGGPNRKGDKSNSSKTKKKLSSAIAKERISQVFDLTIDGTEES